MNYFQKAINNFLQIKKYFKVKKNNKIDISTNLKNSKIIIKGDRNLILIKKSDIKRLKVGIYGENNTLEIYENFMLREPEQPRYYPKITNIMVVSVSR